MRMNFKIIFFLQQTARVKLKIRCEHYCFQLSALCNFTAAFSQSIVQVNCQSEKHINETKYLTANL